MIDYPMVRKILWHDRRGKWSGGIHTGAGKGNLEKQ